MVERLHWLLLKNEMPFFFFFGSKRALDVQYECNKGFGDITPRICRVSRMKIIETEQNKHNKNSLVRLFEIKTRKASAWKSLERKSTLIDGGGKVMTPDKAFNGGHLTSASG